MPDRSRWGTSFSCCGKWSRVAKVTPRAQAQKVPSLALPQWLVTMRPQPLVALKASAPAASEVLPRTSLTYHRHMKFARRGVCSARCHPNVRASARLGAESWFVPSLLYVGVSIAQCARTPWCRLELCTGSLWVSLFTIAVPVSLARYLAVVPVVQEWRSLIQWRTSLRLTAIPRPTHRISSKTGPVCHKLAPLTVCGTFGTLCSSRTVQLCAAFGSVGFLKLSDLQMNSPCTSCQR